MTGMSEIHARAVFPLAAAPPDTIGPRWLSGGAIAKRQPNGLQFGGLGRIERALTDERRDRDTPRRAFYGDARRKRTATRQAPGNDWLTFRPSDRRGPGNNPRPQYAFEMSMFNVSCNSHYFTQLAALFIDARAE